MKTLTVMLLMVAATIAGCSSGITLDRGYYDYIHFSRQGGVEIEFCLYPTGDSNQLKAVVSRYAYKDTTVQMIINNSSDYSEAFTMFHKALNNQMAIKGDFQQTTLPSGSWAYIYCVSNQKETEITNSDLRTSLLKFEQFIDSKM